MSQSIDPSKIASFLQKPDTTDELEDDTCTFSIYSLHPINPIKDELQSYWSSKYFKYSSTKTEFIWHHGHPPDLKSIDDGRIDGSLNYGISLQDEWFLVWCLFEITKKFDCQIHVQDNDGQFLLIEAADHLPKWITPDSAKGRVWIIAGSLHLIPLESTPSTEDHLPVETALEILRTRPHSTIVSESINLNLLNRLNSASPEALTETHLFNTQAYLHIDIAKALQSDPSLIGLAVKTFCEKDADSFKACRDMTRFPPQTPPDPQTSNHTTQSGTHTTWPHLVRMTRPLYAILLNHELAFHPPKPFEKVRWMMVDRENTFEWKRRSLGMKILCGFEMMLSAISPNETDLPSSSNRHTRRYQRYLDKLEKYGYFQGEVQGSKKWTELESTAKAAYRQSLKPVDAMDRFERALACSPLSGNFIHEEHNGESDAWLELDENQLETLLQGVNPHSLTTVSSFQEDGQSDVEMEKMTNFAGQIAKFVDGPGALEGAMHSDDEMTGDDSEGTTTDDSEQEELRADIFPYKNRGVKKNHPWTSRHPSGKYDDEMEKRLAKIVPGLDDTEWGQSTQKLNQPSENDLLYPADIIQGTKEPNSANVSTKPKIKKALPKFAKQSYDGVSDESSQEDSDSDDLNTPSGMAKRATAGETQEDIDMDGEGEEFLNFAREALGLTVEQYEAILNDRREKGAYVPPRTLQNKTESTQDAYASSMSPSVMNSHNLRSSSKGKQPERSAYFDTTKSEVPFNSSVKNDETGTVRNMDLDTFDKLMNRMDEELKEQSQKSRQHIAKGGPISSTPFGPKLGNSPNMKHDLNFEDDLDDESEELEMGEIDEVMHSELADLMGRSGVQLDGHSFEDGKMDYSAISNFLESFKSQVGLPGPVGNMAGRIGLNLNPNQKNRN